ncbi:photoreceptor cilium actin regulator [Trichomycterus rosablanca]|uniref:photoreceptor cilium actin regulator n=1 Tax=Trichomycterus rosablanca TaxID=2290929 RepID=UPI002F35788E
MGCSPSRGNINFNGVQGPFGRGKTLLPWNKENPVDSQSDDGGSESSGSGETDGEACEIRTEREKRLNANGDTVSAPVVKKPPNTESGGAKVTSEKDITVNVSQQSKEELVKGQDAKKDVTKRTKKSKRTHKSTKSIKKKDKGQKVDFPEPLVKAHKAAYDYLNPSIDKYDLLLGLLDHAAQTRISLQPMVAFMALRYEEFNKGLEQMVQEGEKLLKDNGEHLAWPCDMTNLSTSSKPTSSQPPPDLLQQLLQYTVQRKRTVGESIRSIGDIALEEAVEYFSSISEILEEKLNAKHAIEARLMQVLTRIEAASVRRPGTQDSMLFSEDSGIGADNESLGGSDLQRHRRESCESARSSRTILCSSEGIAPRNQGTPKNQRTKEMSRSGSISSIDSTCTIIGEEFRDMESLLGSAFLDDGEEEEEKKQYKGKTKVSSTCPSPDSNRQPRRLPVMRIENPQNVEMTLKMKDAISDKIHFVASQKGLTKIEPKNRILKTNDRQWTDEQEKSPKRPQTAAQQSSNKKTTVTKQRRSRSADSLRGKADDPTLLELERTQKELGQKLERMGKVRMERNIKKDIVKQVQGKQTQTGVPIVPSSSKKTLSLNNQRRAVNEKTAIKQGGVKEPEEIKPAKKPVKATPPPSPPQSPRQYSGMCRRGNSVKKLIDTFSQGTETSKQNLSSDKVLGPLKGVRKCGVPIIPGLPVKDTLFYNNNLNTNNQGKSRTFERTDDFDPDNLPPPPLEVLMDNSFENIEVSKTDEGISSRGRSTCSKMTSISQRLRASMQSVAVLPSKGSLRRTSHSISPARSVAGEQTDVLKKIPIVSKPEEDSSNEEAARTLYQQARKIIHLRHSTDSLAEKPTADPDPIKYDPIRTNAERKQGDQLIPEALPSTAASGIQPSDTPPASKTRMLPSTPILHRRLLSPPVFKKQPNSSSPLRKLPTPPSANQWSPSSTPVMQQEVTPSPVSGNTFPFKAPSPPASPKVQRRFKDNNTEDFVSKSFSNARSVFCPASPSLFEAQPIPAPKPPQAWTSSGSSILPRPWGEQNRLSMAVRGPQPFIRRSQSDRRPSLRIPPRAPVVSIAQTCGSEPALSSQGLEDGPISKAEAWNELPELRGTNRSASHPDLCVVGQALQCE